MIRLIVSLAGVFLGLNIGQAQVTETGGFGYVDAHVDSLEMSDTMDVLQRTLHLTAPFSQDLEKVRAIYRYITTTISYDDEAYRNGHRRINRSEQDILSRGKAVCWGYAELMRLMCENIEIACVTVTGYAKDAPVPISAYEKANHAWNAVRLGQEWKLIDATWGSGALKGVTPFTEVDDINYFLAGPELLIHSHFPLMKMWQLLRCPVSYEDFLAYTFPSADASCEYNFPVHIDYFLSQDHFDRQVAIVREAHEVSPTHNTRLEIGHALVDVAVHRKELGDAYLEADSVAAAIEEFEAATRIFEAARNYATFYPWQTKTMVFAWANLAQSLHRREAELLRPHETVQEVVSKLDLLLKEPEVELEAPLRRELNELISGLRRGIE